MSSRRPRLGVLAGVRLRGPDGAGNMAGSPRSSQLPVAEEHGFGPRLGSALLGPVLPTAGNGALSGFRGSGGGGGGCPAGLQQEQLEEQQQRGSWSCPDVSFTLKFSCWFDNSWNKFVSLFELETNIAWTFIFSSRGGTSLLMMFVTVSKHLAVVTDSNQPKHSWLLHLS